MSSVRESMDEKPQLSFAGYFLSVLAVAAFLGVCSDERERCDILNIRDFPSPDSVNMVTAFEFDCYNSTGCDTHLQLRRPGAKLQVPGNIYTISFGGEFTVSWRSRSNVIVSFT